MRDFAQIKLALTTLAGALLAATPSAAQTPGALAGLQSGAWQLRNVNRGNQAARSMCVRNPAQLLQIRHGGRACQRRILNESGSSVTARYECSGSGWGQTSVTVETPRLARIDTQGIANGSPFHDVYEARRTGACS